MDVKSLALFLVFLLASSTLIYIFSTSRELAVIGDPVKGLWRSVLSSKHFSGTLTLKGLNSEVVIVWDKWGVPYIFADNEEDLYYAFGFAQGYDRMFQMDITRRLSSGRLSELLGEATLDSDSFFKVLGLHRVALETWEMIYSNPEMERYARALKAFSKGVNAYIEWAVKNDVLPPEYKLLSVNPEPWTPIDSLCIGKLIAWGLAGGFEDLELKAFLDANGYDALVKLKLLERPLNTPILGGVLDAEYPRGSWMSFSRNTGETRISREFIEWLSSIEEVVKSIVGEAASNNWVISGNLTESGYPILANDPHLSLQAPPTWYEACLVLKSKGLTVRGVTFPGIPVIVIGRNNYVAWGFTNVGADVTDFYYYVWKRGEYLYKGEWLKPESIVEEIRVRKSGDFEVLSLKVNFTVHGPLIERYGEKYAMAWTGLQPTLELVALYLMNYAEDVYDIVEAQKYFSVPAQNAVYADVKGNIAYYPAGLYPIRSNVPLIKSGEKTIPNMGFLPFNGSRGEGEWKDVIPFNEIPHVFNPKRGYVVTANNAPVPSDSKKYMIPVTYKYYLGWRWADRFRHDRIVEMIEDVLSKKGKISIEDVMKMQYDYKSLAAETIVPLLISAIKGRISELSPLEIEAVKLLEDWDYTMYPDRAEPAIHSLWLLKFYDKLWEDEYRASGIKGKFLPLEILEYVLRGEIEGWGEFREWTDKPLDQLCTESLKEAVSELKARFGGDIKAWKWGEIHYYKIDHPLGSVLSWMNYPRYEAPGGMFTVNVAGGLEVSSGPSIRYIADLTPGKTGYIVLPGGNMGHPLSNNYYDQLEMWVNGGYKELGMPSEPSEVSELQYVLKLEPER